MNKSDSVFLSALFRLGKAIAAVYDNSTIERVFARIAAFFAKQADESRILDFFRRRFMSGAIADGSRFVSLLCSPTKAARNFCGKHGSAFENAAASGLCATLANPSTLSLHNAGLLLLSFGVGLLPNLFVHVGTPNRIGTALVLLCGLLLLPFSASFSELFFGSALVRTLSRALGFSDDTEHAFPLTPTDFSGKIPLMLLCFVFGLSSIANGSIGALVLLCGFFGCLYILLKPLFGALLLVFCAPLLPTMALAGLSLLTAVSYGLHLFFDRRVDYRRTPFFLWIVAFVLLSLVSALGGVTPTASLKIFLIYFSFMLAFPLLTNLIKTERDFSRLATVVILSAFLVSAYGVFQNFFLSSTTQSWVDSSMFSEIEKRVYSTLDNPNVLGEYLILFIPLAVACFFRAKDTLSKSVYFLMNLCMVLCLLYTWSRGAWVGTVLALGFFLLQKDRRWLIVGLCALCLMPSVLPASILHRLTSIGNMNDTSTAYRVSVWQGSLRLIADYGLSGVGLGSDAFLRIYPKYALNGAEYALHSHNFYLQWIVDMGFGGIVVYFGMILTAFSCILRARRKNGFSKTAALAFSGGLVGYLFHGMAENLWYNYRMVLVFFVYLAMISLTATLGKEATTKADEQNGTVAAPTAKDTDRTVGAAFPERSESV